jgi:hypothetical protein
MRFTSVRGDVLRDAKDLRDHPHHVRLLRLPGRRRHGLCAGACRQQKNVVIDRIKRITCKNVAINRVRVNRQWS